MKTQVVIAGSGRTQDEEPELVPACSSELCILTLSFVSLRYQRGPRTYLSEIKSMTHVPVIHKDTINRGLYLCIIL